MVPVDVTDRQQRPAVKCARCGSPGSLRLDHDVFVCSDPIGCAARIVLLPLMRNARRRKARR